MLSPLRRHRWFAPLRLLTATLVVQIACLLLWGLTWPGEMPVELSFIVPQDEVAPWQIVIADFEASYPHIRVNLVTNAEATYTTDQRKAIYSADFQADVAQYDLAYVDLIWIPEFADQLMDLRPLVQRDQLDLSGFLPGELAVGTVKEALYRLPMRADVGVLYYRQDLLNQAGFTLPSTLTELAQVVKTLKQTSDIDLGYLWQGRSYEGLVANFVEVMGGVGATWIDSENAQVGLDNATTLQAARLLLDLLQQGISPPIVTD